jgi:polyhydroxybutyrate depolymerase
VNAPEVSPKGARAEKAFRLKLCTEAPLILQAPPGALQTRGCVVTFSQSWSDPATIAWAKAARAERRYVVYVPTNLPARAVPVVFVFPGSTCNAEAAAVYNTHTRFEQLADRDGFIVVYGNGLPTAAHSGNEAPMQKGGFLPACWAEHTGEGLDVTYVRLIVEQLAAELNIDRARIYATGLSQGGGMSFQLALEAPDLVAAIAPVAGVPFQPSGEWLRSCHPKPGYEQVSIAMLAATADPFIPYAPGASLEIPEAVWHGGDA